MKEEEENKIKFINDQLKINQQGFETINNSIVEDEKKLQNSFNDKKISQILAKLLQVMI